MESSKGTPDDLYIGNLREELADTGIQITVICGDLTHPPFRIHYRKGKVAGTVRIHPKATYQELAALIKHHIEQMGEYRK